MSEQEGDVIDISIPRSVADLGIPVSLVHDLVLRQALVQGRTSTLRLSAKLALSPTLLTPVIEDLRELRYLEVQGVENRDYLLAPTEAGRAQATDRMQLSRYMGPTPVSLPAYSAIIARQHAEPRANLEQLKNAFSDLVISDDLLREVGHGPGDGDVDHISFWVAHVLLLASLHPVGGAPPVHRHEPACVKER